MENDTFMCVFTRMWVAKISTSYNDTYGNVTHSEKIKTKYAYVQERDGTLPFSDVHHLIASRIVVIICGFGLLGNLMALVLLMHRRKKLAERRSHRSSESRSAKSDLWCFIALSLSDFCFCAVLVPQWYMDVNSTMKTETSFLLSYELYEDALVNTFVLSSTWLTVSMTINRYIHLSHPIWALRYLGRHFLLVAIFVSVVFSVVFNVPRFWLRHIISVDCINHENTTVYYIHDIERSWEGAYRWTYFAIGIVVPLCCLAYSNARIISAVCRSMAIEQRRNHERNLITRTLIFVVFFYICLVSPTELIKFFEPALSSTDSGTSPFLLINAVANLLQAINFSCNFVPYLILDKTIRQSLMETGCQRRQRRQSTVLSHSMTGRANGSLYDGISSKRLPSHHVRNCIRMTSQQSMTVPFSTEITRFSSHRASESLPNGNDADSLSALKMKNDVILQ